MDFNPRSPRGERQDILPVAAQGETGNFNPRSPRGERLMPVIGRNCLSRFQSTLPARGATVNIRQKILFDEFQSTLPARGATIHITSIPRHFLFQSTLPARGATVKTYVPQDSRHDFNPRSPRGERPGGSVPLLSRTAISIHAPREGSDSRGRAW